MRICRTKPLSTCIAIVNVLVCFTVNGFPTSKVHRSKACGTRESFDKGNSERVFELCHVDAGGSIVECEVFEEHELGEAVGKDQAETIAARKRKDSELLFATHAFSTKSNKQLLELKSKDVVLTFEEWQSISEVPVEVISRSFGPDYLAQPNSKSTEPPQRNLRYHVHFGAGRLGLGLVVPALAASGIPFAVIQRPQSKWAEIFDSHEQGGMIDFKVNGHVVVHNVQIINAELGLPRMMPPRALVFGRGTEELQPVLNRAQTFSCSLGGSMFDVMTTMLQNISVNNENEPPVLFCCENEHAAVKKLKEHLRDKVRVIDCIVDRVCSGRHIQPDAVDIDTEPWRGSIAVLEPGFDSKVPFAKGQILLSRSWKEAEFLSQRKFRLVNCIHCALSFLTLINQYEGSDDREYILEKYTSMSRIDRLKIEAWRAAHIGALIDEFGMEALKEWHKTKLDEEVWEALLRFSDAVLVDRFSALDDLVSRVLGGGVTNRWITRLKPVEKWALKRRSQAEARAIKVKINGTDSLSADEQHEDQHNDEIRAFYVYALRRGPARSQTTNGRSVSAIESRISGVTSCFNSWSPSSAVSEMTGSLGEAEAAEIFITQQLLELVLQSRSFCTREIDKKHKILMKEQQQSGGEKFSPTVRKALELEVKRENGQAQP